MEIVTIEKNKLVGEIQDILTAWLKEKPEVRTVASLSRATGVTDPTIRRLMNNNVKINDDAIFKMLAHIFEVQTFDGISAALEKKQEVLKWFERSYSYLKNAPELEAYKNIPFANEITLNPIAFSVFALVSSLPVTTTELIKEQFGVRGEVEMEKLIQQGVLGISESKVFVRNEKKVRIDKDQAISLLPEITRTYLKKDSIHNYRALEVEAVSQEGYVALMDLFSKFLNDVHAIYNDKPGNIPVIVAGFLDTFTTQPYFEGGKNETLN